MAGGSSSAPPLLSLLSTLALSAWLLVATAESAQRAWWRRAAPRRVRRSGHRRRRPPARARPRSRCRRVSSPRAGPTRRRGGSARRHSGAGRARVAAARPAVAGSHTEADADTALLLRRAAGAKQLVSASSHLLFRATMLAMLALVVLFAVHYPSLLSHSFSLSALPASGSGSSSSSSSPRSRHSHWSLLGSGTSSSYGWGAAWEREVRRNTRPRGDGSLSVVVTGAAGFVGSRCSLALRARGDGVLGLDNFNAYYDPSLKSARQRLLACRGVVVLDADVNDAALLERLLSVVPFTHVRTSRPRRPCVTRYGGRSTAAAAPASAPGAPALGQAGSLAAAAA